MRTDVRAALPVRTRVIASLTAVALIHVVGIVLLASAGSAAGPLAVLALAAYGRGLVHAVDFDHVSMIDNSIRKFVAEGRRPVSVGLAFSAGHSTVVLLSSALLVLGVSAVAPALNPDSTAAQVLGVIGLSVSGAYLLVCAIANLPRFVRTLRARRALDNATDAAPDDILRAPGGLLSRLAALPLRWVRHPRHIFLLGFAFSLGFDTSSQIGLLVVLAGAGFSGASPIALMAIPVLFTAAITLADSLNGMFMLRLYVTTDGATRRHLDWSLVVTGIGIVSALAVAVLAGGALARTFGWELVPDLDTTNAGAALVGVFLVIGAGAIVTLRRARARTVKG
jgi:high-affinity nickel-transport protein